MTLYVGYESFGREGSSAYQGVTRIRFGRETPASVHGTEKLGAPTASLSRITQAVLALYDRLADRRLQVRRMSVAAIRLCRAQDALPPMFLWSLAERDRREGRDSSRVFVRMVTNILLHLAAVDDDVSMAEAEYITDVSDRLSAVCDSAGVKPSKGALNAADYVTSGESSFIGEGNIHREFTPSLYSLRMARRGGGRLTVRMEDFVLGWEIRSPSSFIR